MKRALENEVELYARVFQFPTSAIKLKGRKINYYDFLSRAENEDANEALKRIEPRIDIEQIERFIDQVTGVSDLQKEFYKVYVNARYKLIICPAMELVTAEDQEETGPTLTM